MMHLLVLIGATALFLHITPELTGGRLAETTVYASERVEIINKYSVRFLEGIWPDYSLAITHGEVLAAALHQVTIVVARRAVTATFSIVLQYLLKEFRAIAIEDRLVRLGCHSALAAGNDLWLYGPIAAAIHTMAFGVIDKGQHFGESVMATGALDLQRRDETRRDEARIEIRSCLFNWLLIC